MEKQESEYNLIDWWKKVVFKNYTNFTGRARRAEYWYFILGNFIIIAPFYIIGIVGITLDDTFLTSAGMVAYCLVLVGTLIPGLGVTVRRLHDTNKSGWFYFISLIPLIGSIFILIWLFTDGDRFTNNYGNDPKKTDDLIFDFEQTT